MLDKTSRELLARTSVSSVPSSENASRTSFPPLASARLGSNAATRLGEMRPSASRNSGARVPPEFVRASINLSAEAGSLNESPATIEAASGPKVVEIRSFKDNAYSCSSRESLGAAVSKKSAGEINRGETETGVWTERVTGSLSPFFFSSLSLFERLEVGCSAVENEGRRSGIGIVSGLGMKGNGGRGIAEVTLPAAFRTACRSRISAAFATSSTKRFLKLTVRLLNTNLSAGPKATASSGMVSKSTNAPPS
mmetsp:Transcript_14069/g.21332  ORF Transcript_14069/g.21332 Transcript_14069/m.21332 type:complete len:252 (+) Transcript_14069:213-968(+)